MSLKQQTNDTTEKDIQISDKPVAWTDDEILKLWAKKNKLNGAQDIIDFARELLKKASEK
jgi:hypothetical protein